MVDPQTPHESETYSSLDESQIQIAQQHLLPSQIQYLLGGMQTAQIQALTHPNHPLNNQ